MPIQFEFIAGSNFLDQLEFWANDKLGPEYEHFAEEPVTGMTDLFPCGNSGDENFAQK